MSYKCTWPAAEQIERGELKFSLEGSKLNGSFVLVKLKRISRDSKKGNEWLLIKHHDGYADPSWDIESHDRSAVTGRTPDEIKDGTPLDPARAGDLDGAQRVAMPSRVEPMLATLVEEPFSDPDWLFELKWDGMRALARIEKGQWKLWSRTGRTAVAQYPELAVLPERLAAKEALVDGEIVVLDAEGRADFERMQSRMHVVKPSDALLESAPITYYVFDILYCDGFDLRAVPLIERKQFLRRILDWRPPVFLGLRNDIDPAECRLETERPSPPPPPPARPVSALPVLTSWQQLTAELERGRAVNVVAEIEGKEFRLSNLNKVYFKSNREYLAVPDTLGCRPAPRPSRAVPVQGCGTAGISPSAMPVRWG